MAYTFRPVRGEEQKIKQTTPVEGFVYFSTDTKKIFMAKDGEFVPMGGNSGIYYGSRELTEEEKEDTELVRFVFSKNEIEGTQIPIVDDLILNIPDGCFYRVTNVIEGESIVTTKLTIAGSGGGGGPVGPTTTIRWEDLTTNKDFVVGEKEMLISFRAKVLGAVEDNRIEKVAIALNRKADKLIEVTKAYEFGDIITVNIADASGKMDTDSDNTLIYIITDSYGQEFTYSTTYYLHELILETDVDSIISTIDNAVCTYICRPKGGRSLQRYIRITLAPVENPNAYVYDNTDTVVKEAGALYNITVPVAEKCKHGVYVLTASLCGLLSGDAKRVISSIPLTHQIIYYETAVNTPLIAGHIPSTKIQQYDSSLISYMIIDKQALTSEVPVVLSMNTDTSNVNAVLETVNVWKKTFNKTGFFEPSIKYENQTKVLPKIEVTPYEGELPVIDETNMELYLTAQGRSNTESAKDSWTYKNISGKFENFLWGTANGWQDDEEGTTSLKLTNGAKFTLPNYSPFATRATKVGLTIELDFKFSGVLNYSKPLIHCLSRDPEGKIVTGFNLTGQRATLNSDKHKATVDEINGGEDVSEDINKNDMALQAFNQYYNENERIHLTYVIDYVPENAPKDRFYFVYTYLNGVLSGIMRLDNGEEFEDDMQNASLLTFDSTYGDIDIYNIRVYRSPLTSRTVINNYIADLTDIDKKIALYKSNNIFTDDGLINIKAIENIGYQLEVPYVLLKGGSKMPKKFKDDISYSTEEDKDFALPLTKSDYRLMSMKMYDRHKDNVNPVIDIPIELEDANGSKINDFKNIKLKTSYKMNRGVQVYGQGTSSMVYPVKNLRLKFRLEEDYPIVYDGAYPVEIVCFKADFMDSSASHNTGTANLIYDLLRDMSLFSPAQQFKRDNNNKDGVAKYDLLTAIRGFPIVCFYAEGDSDNYSYVGRYNFNIDKATPEPFGFFPQKFYTGETVVDDDGKERKEVKCIGLKTEKVKGKTVLPLDAEGEEIERDIIQCWEVLNNDTGSPTKFLTSADQLKDYIIKNIYDGEEDQFDENRNYFRDFEPGYLFKEILKTKFGNEDAGYSYGWMDYYEDRYPDAMVGGAASEWDSDEDPYENLEEDLENGLFRLACWINSTAVPLPGEENKVTNEVTYRPITPAYYPTRDTSYDPSKNYYEKIDGALVKRDIVVTRELITKTGIVDSDITANISNVAVDKNIFEEKVNNNLGDYTFIYSSEINQWSLETGELIGENLNEYGITFSGTPENAVYIKITYYQRSNWNDSLWEEYTIDNENYRLAKFKAEFTDYFNLDFALFYYVLTMLLLMMDSRAKNMMLASWDQKIWYPIFYDMDTALGVNNTGFNKFAYDTEDDPADKVFNGFDSVLWNNFRTCFYPNICKFYSDLKGNKGNLSVGKLLKTYNENASDKWNEALTTADAEYKYIRPYEEGYLDGKNLDENGKPKPVAPGTTSYLYAGQGKRTNHRSYWLTNRVSYLDSKYIPPTINPSSGITIDAFNFRAYALPEQQSNNKTAECVAQTPANHRFTLTALNNSYQSIYIGNILYGPTYTQANQKVTLGPSQVKHEVESYILNPGLVADLGDLSDKYLGQFNFPSLTRLTELKFGRSSRSHKTGEYEKYYNNLLSSLTIGESCPYLQKVNIARCTGLKTISLTECYRLREVDAEGTTLTSIDFPQDSLLEKLYLPDTLTSLELINQPYLETIVFDTANGSSSLRKIHLDKAGDFDSYNIIKAMMRDNAAVASKTYYLTNVNWILDQEDDFIVENGKVVAIDILEKLQKARPEGSHTMAQALTGTIYVDIAKTIGQFEIYEKYTKVFPSLKIVYSDNVNLEEAKEIRFFMDEDASEPYFTVYTDGTRTMAELVSKSGPGGKDLMPPTKNPTDTNSFTFAECWIWNGEEILEADFSTFTPLTDMDLYPKYNVVERRYSVKFYDWDSSTAVDDEVPYGTSLAALPNYRYRDSSDLDIYDRWAFQGWSTAKYNDGPVNNPSYLDLSTLTVTTDIIAYAHYVKEDVREVATRDEYFDFVLRDDIKIPFDEPLEGNELRSEYREGYRISIKEKYKSSLAGKITLPSEYNGKPIISIGDCVANNITHVFFLKDCDTYLEISNEAFASDKNATYQCSSLIAVYTPNSIVKIGESVFEDTKTLKHFNLNDGVLEIKQKAFRNSGVEINELPASLRRMETQAFWGVANITVTKLPKNLEILPMQGFYDGTSTGTNSNISITRFENNLRIIQEKALMYSGENVQENTLYIGPSVAQIGQNAFGKGANNLGWSKKIKHILFAKNVWEFPGYEWAKDGDLDVIDSAERQFLYEIGFENVYSIDAPKYSFGYTEETEVIV